MPKGMKKTWTDRQVAYLVVKKTQEKPFVSILKGLKRKFPNEGFDNMHVNTVINKWNRINETTAHTFNQQEVDFVYASMLNNFPTIKIIRGFSEQFGKKITEKSINSVIRKRKTTLLIEHENEVEKEIAKTAKKIKKEVKKMKTGQWTKTENKKLMKCESRKQVIDLARKLNRSENSAYQKWYVARKAKQTVMEMATKLEEATPVLTKGRYSVEELDKLRECNSVEEALACGINRTEYSITRKFSTLTERKPVKKESKPKKSYTPRWTKEEDFDLLCNFYELSIDEARDRFNRSFGAIATRLEKLVDSTQPNHQALLMEASKAIKNRKRAERKPTKLTRKQRRVAKREAKIHKRMARLQSQLKEE